MLLSIPTGKFTSYLHSLHHVGGKMNYYGHFRKQPWLFLSKQETDPTLRSKTVIPGNDFPMLLLFGALI